MMQDGVELAGQQGVQAGDVAVAAIWRTCRNSAASRGNAAPLSHRSPAPWRATARRRNRSRSVSRFRPGPEGCLDGQIRPRLKSPLGIDQPSCAATDRLGVLGRRAERSERYPSRMRHSIGDNLGIRATIRNEVVSSSICSQGRSQATALYEPGSPGISFTSIFASRNG